MALAFKTVIFQKQSGIGLQSVTGIGFRPKVLLFCATCTSLNTFQSSATVLFGFADDDGEEISFGVGNEDNASSEQARSHWRTADVWSDSQNGTSFQQEAILFTMENDGFNFFWQINNSLNWQIACIAIGGSDLSDSAVGHFTVPSSTGIDPVSGVGFQPDLVFLLGTNHTSDNVARSDRASFSFGAFNLAGEQGVSSVIMVDGVDPMNTARYQRTNKCLAMFSTSSIVPTTPSLTHEASFSSMNSNGFSLNYNKASGSGKRVAYLAIKGVSSKIGAITSPTSSTGNQTTSGLGSFIPRGLVLFSYDEIANTVPISDCRFSLGAGNSSSSRWANWAGDEDNASSTISATHEDNDEIIRIANEASNASSSATLALADLTSVSTGQFRLNWSIIDPGHAYQIIYVLIGDKPAGPTLFTRSITGTVSINTTVTGGKLRTRAVTAALTVASNVVALKEGLFPAIINEFIAIAALVSKRKSGEGEFHATIAEFVQIQTTTTRLRSMSRSISETLSIAGVLTRQTLISRSLAATAVVNSTVARLRIGLGDIFINEFVTIADSIERLRTARITINETIEIVTIPVRRLTANREIAALVTVIGNLTDRVRSVFLNINEFVTVSSALARQRFIFRTINETVAISAIIAELRSVFRTINEVAEINSTVTRILFAFRQASAALTSTAGVVRLRTVPRGLPQSLTISDSLARIAFFFRSISNESLNVAAGLRFFIVGTPEVLVEELGRFWTRVSQETTISKVWNILKRIPSE